MGKKISIKTRLILIDKGNILLIKQTKPNGGKFTFVGGRVEKEEFAKASLVREATEEARIKINPKDLQLVHVLHKKDTQNMRIILYFKTEKWEGEPLNQEPEKFQKVKWHKLDSLPKTLSRTARHVLKMYRTGYLYSELERVTEKKNGSDKNLA